MFGFFKKPREEYRRASGAPPDSETPHSSQQHSNVHRELIRVVLKDTLRLHGVPFHWLACEVILITKAPGEENLHIQLVILKWNEQLLRFAPALQQQLLLGLDRFDPAVDHSKYIVSWRFAPDCGCPFPWMPEPKVWTQNTQPPAMIAEEPPCVLDRRRTKRPAPATRDTSSGFSPTEIAPLQ